MPRSSQISFAFPEFAGLTRRLVLVNLIAYFALLLVQLATHSSTLALTLGLSPANFLRGALWQPFTYSFIHLGLTSTLLELLSLWFVGKLIEDFHGASWLLGLYAVSVLGAAAAAIGLSFVFPGESALLVGSMTGIFGMLTAIGILHGDMEFLMFFAIRIKARYLALIYALVALAELFGQSRLSAIATLGAALAAFFYCKAAPKAMNSPTRGLSELWYSLRNSFYRNKRRRAAKKFEVYMKKQGRTVRFDGQGRYIDDDRQN